MKNPFNFESEPFEFDSEFDEYEEEQPDTYSEFGEELEGFDTEMTDLEWEEEARRGRWIPIRPRAPRFRPVRRRRPPIPRRRFPTKRPLWWPVSPRPKPPIIVDRKPPCPKPPFPRPPFPKPEPQPKPPVDSSEPPITEPEPQGTEYIRWVQSSLNQIMGLRLPVNGIMGPETRSAIRSFQQRQGLPVDGVVGPDTERALMAARASKKNGADNKQPSEPADSQPLGPEDTQPSEPGEFWEFDTDSEFDEEFESDFEGEPFETYYEFDEAELVYEDTVAIPGGNLCGVVHRDVKKMYGSLADLWQKLRDRRSTNEIKRARAALYKDVKRIVRRLRGGWYAKKGCKKFDFNWINSKAVNMTSDKELRQDKYVRKMSKWLSDYAKKAL